MKRPPALSALLTLHLGGGFLVLGLLLGVTAVEGVARLLEQGFRDQAEALARQLGTISLDALLVSDYGTLERYLHDLGRQPGVRYLQVRRADGEVLAETGERPDPLRAGARVDVLWPVRLGANRIGDVEVSYDAAPVREAVMRISLVGGGGLVLGLALLYLWLRHTLERRIIRPVEIIAARVGDRADEADVAWERMPEELGRIARRLSRLCAEIEDSGRRRETSERLARGATLRLCREQRLASVGQMAAGLAHGLNTPLGNIIGYAQQAAKGSGDTRLRGRLAVIEEQARVCAGIVRNLLDSVRPPEARPRPVNLRERVQAAAGLMAPVLRDRGVAAIDVVVEGAAPAPVWADPACVEQVLFNLMTNAADAGARTLTLTVAADAGAVQLTVADDGGGVPEDIRQRLFAAFVTGKPPGEGTGLGLHICRTLLNSVGAEIELLDSSPAGSRFRITWRTAEVRP